MPKSGPIIIVEDDHDDQEMIREVLGELRVPNILYFFNSCNAALHYLSTTIEHPFLIISDINIPAMSGLEFLKSIKEESQLKKKNIPFVFLTTSSDQTMMKEAYQLSADGYFVKPTSLADLKEMMVRIVEYWKLAGRPS